MFAHRGQRLPPDIRRGRLGVERIACQQDGRCALLTGVVREPRDDGVTRLAQPARQVARETAKALAEMQVARMDEADHAFTDDGAVPICPRALAMTSNRMFGMIDRSA